MASVADELLAALLVYEAHDVSRRGIDPDLEVVGVESIVLERNGFIEDSRLHDINIEGLVAAGRHFVHYELHFGETAGRESLAPYDLGRIGLPRGIPHEDGSHVSLSDILDFKVFRAIEIGPSAKLRGSRHLMGEDIRFDEHLASVRMQVIRHYRLSQPFLELDPVRQVAERLIPGFPGLAVGLHVAGNRFPVGFINRGACEDVVELVEGYVSPKVFVQVMGIFVAVDEPAQGIEEFSFIKGLLAVAVAFLVLGDCGIAAFEHILHFAPVDRTSVHFL